MLRDTLVEMYDAQLRGAPEMHDAPAVTQIGPVLAGTFPVRRRCFVTYPPFEMSGADLDHLIDDVIAHATADERVDHIKWKVREHDPLPGLLERLQGHGFTVDETETVLAGRVEDLIGGDPGVPEGYTTERATTESALREAERLAGQVFGDSPQRIREQEDELVALWRAAPQSFEMWLARDRQGSVVCSGRVDFVDGTDFAGLWGGACDHTHRGRGLYRALVAQRARSAQAHGKRFIQVDCSEDSRPILETSRPDPHHEGLRRHPESHLRVNASISGRSGPGSTRGCQNGGTRGRERRPGHHERPMTESSGSYFAA